MDASLRRALACSALLVLLMMHAHTAQAAVSCGQVASSLASCLSYLTKGGAKPVSGSSCCSGVKKLNSIASSTQARQQICSCLENLAQSAKPLSSSVSSLPGACGVPFPYSFSTNQDCSKIQ